MISSILTDRERSVFLLLVQGLDTRNISYELGISEKTVRNHISNVIQKLGASSRVGAVIELLKLKEISL